MELHITPQCVKIIRVIEAVAYSREHHFDTVSLRYKRSRMQRIGGCCLRSILVRSPLFFVFLFVWGVSSSHNHAFVAHVGPIVLVLVPVSAPRLV